MRYYKIEIDGFPAFTSYANGRTNPGALQIEMDIPVAAFSSPHGLAFVKIWGVPLETISQTRDFNFKKIKVYGGFQKGLPLANPTQAGLLVQGYISQAFGNWIGKEMSLDIYISPGDGPQAGATRDTPKNLVLNWRKGSSLSEAIKSTLTTAYPGFTTKINIDSKLVLQNDEPGIFENLVQFSQYIQETSRNIIGKNYPGVSITLVDRVFNVFDGSQPGSQAKTVDFKDLIGQPTWIESPSIQFKCAMRSDFQVGDRVIMPKTVVTNSAQAQSSLINQKVSFTGEFEISVMRHVGNFRQPDASAWVTVYNAFPRTVAAA